MDALVQLELPLPYYKNKALMSMNVYRNLHPFLLNKFKIEYGNKLKPLLTNLDKFNTPIQLRYELHFKGSKSRDLVNIVSMIDKVFSDVLVQLEIIVDDNMKFINKVSMVGYINQLEDKCIVTIKEAI